MTELEQIKAKIREAIKRFEENLFEDYFGVKAADLKNSQQNEDKK